MDIFTGLRQRNRQRRERNRQRSQGQESISVDSQQNIASLQAARARTLMIQQDAQPVQQQSHLQSTQRDTDINIAMERRLAEQNEARQEEQLRQWVQNHLDEIPIRDRVTRLQDEDPESFNNTYSQYLIETDMFNSRYIVEKIRQLSIDKCFLLMNDHIILYIKTVNTDLLINHLLQIGIATENIPNIPMSVLVPYNTGLSADDRQRVTTETIERVSNTYNIYRGVYVGTLRNSLGSALQSNTLLSTQLSQQEENSVIVAQESDSRNIERMPQSTTFNIVLNPQANAPIDNEHILQLVQREFYNYILPTCISPYCIGTGGSIHGNERYVINSNNYYTVRNLLFDNKYSVDFIELNTYITGPTGDHLIQLVHPDEHARANQIVQQGRLGEDIVNQSLLTIRHGRNTPNPRRPP